MNHTSILLEKEKPSLWSPSTFASLSIIFPCLFLKEIVFLEKIPECSSFPFYKHFWWTSVVIVSWFAYILNCLDTRSLRVFYSVIALKHLMTLVWIFIASVGLIVFLHSCRMSVINMFNFIGLSMSMSKRVGGRLRNKERREFSNGSWNLGMRE